jgi:hypothetical protein
MPQPRAFLRAAAIRHAFGEIFGAKRFLNHD